MTVRIPSPPKIPAATWRERVLLVWLPLFIAVAVTVALIAWASTADAADKVKVKADAMLSLSCPGDGIERGGSVTWFDKRNVSLGTVSGVVVNGTVTFGPAPKKVEYAVVQLDCVPPPTTTTVAATTTSTSTSTTTTTTLPPTTTTLPDPNVYLEGSVFVTDQGAFIIGDPSIPGVRNCPTGYTADFAQSTFTHPPNITIIDWTELFVPPTIFAVANDLTTGTVVYRVACVPA